MKTYTMADLCDAFGLTPRAVRFYEERGLLSPVREGLVRIFNRRDYVRLQLIIRGKKFGFSLRQIGDLLDVYDKPNGQRKQLEQVLPELQFQLKSLREEYEELGSTIVELDDRCETIKELLIDPASSQRA